MKNRLSLPGPDSSPYWLEHEPSAVLATVKSDKITKIRKVTNPRNTAIGGKTD
jgi:hypothetical protein